MKYLFKTKPHIIPIYFAFQPTCLEDIPLASSRRWSSETPVLYFTYPAILYNLALIFDHIVINSIILKYLFLLSLLRQK